MGQDRPIRSTNDGLGPGGPGASDIPDKLYFRIGEVAKLCEVPTYVLRFWEGEFPQLKPNKGGTGQRLYRRRDVEMAMRIKRLLYDEGYTIPGARQVFKTELRSKESQLQLLATEAPNLRQLHGLRRELQAIAAMLARPVGRSAEIKTMQPIRAVRRAAPRTAPSATPGTSEFPFDFPFDGPVQS